MSGQPNSTASYYRTLTPWSRTLLEEARSSSAGQEFSDVLRNPNVYYSVHNSHILLHPEPRQSTPRTHVPYIAILSSNLQLGLLRSLLSFVIRNGELFHTAVYNETVVLRNVTPCSLVQFSRRFRGFYCFLHQGKLYVISGFRPEYM